MKITITTTDRKNIRAKDFGDYRVLPNGDWEILVADTKNEDYNLLVGLHEFLEMWTSAKEGVKEETITAFDEMFVSEPL